MTKRLVLDEATGTVQCPFRGATAAATCAACPDARGRTTYQARDAIVCRPASRIFPPENLSGW